MQSFVVYCVFIIIFAITCISRRDIQSEQNGIHAIKWAIKRNGGTFSEKLFDSISIEDDVWAWLQGPFVMFFYLRLYIAVPKFLPV